jgi:hypothetical protein
MQQSLSIVFFCPYFNCYEAQVQCIQHIINAGTSYRQWPVPAEYRTALELLTRLHAYAYYACMHQPLGIVF